MEIAYKLRELASGVNKLAETQRLATAVKIAFAAKAVALLRRNC